MSRKKKLLLALAIVAVVVVGLFVYVALAHTGSDQLTVTELKAQVIPDSGRIVQVKGEVNINSVAWDSQNSILSFAISDSSNTVDVVYRGVPPDKFKPGTEVALEGRYTASGVFEVQKFLSRGFSLCGFCH